MKSFFKYTIVLITMSLLSSCFKDNDDSPSNSFEIKDFVSAAERYSQINETTRYFSLTN